jgi:DeoR/GlpR family transcriptional regulator of sugar metabolism
VGVNDATVRRDLIRLEQTGKIVRTYGGAMPAGGFVGDDGESADRGRKSQIGRAAAQLVEPGQSIVISGGSTTLDLARHLVLRTDLEELTVITNALPVVEVLVARPEFELIVLGGVVRPDMHSLLGHLTELACRELRADVLYMGAGALSLKRGVMNDHVPEILTDRALRRTADSVVVVADSAKFGRVAPAFVFDLEEVSTIVTDDGVDPEIVADLEARGIGVVVAAAQGEPG